jgi:hypothetical protein
MSKRSKSTISIESELTFNRNYSKISSSTGISSKRLKEIRKGGKATKQEASLIASYGKKDKQVSIQIVSRLSGFSKQSIQERMKFGKKSSKSGRVTRFKTDNTVIDLSYHLDGSITGKRGNGQKVIYYVIIKEDLITGNVTVGHGFQDYNSWLIRGKPASREQIWTRNGQDYERVTYFYNMLSVDLAKEVESYKYNPKPLEIKKANYRSGQKRRHKKDKKE